MRRTGIDVIGDVPWGTHFCQFYETSKDLIDILVPYFQEGLNAQEFCMWVTSEPLKVDQATEALRKAVPDLNDYIAQGQIEILDYSQWYTRSGKFSADEVLKGWVDKLTEVQEKGYEGLRLTGNTFWLEKADWDDFTKYEETVNNVIGRYNMLAICTYSLQKCNALEILDVVANHQFALIKRSGQWEIIESDRHRKTEQALRESEENLRKTTRRFQAIVDNAPVAIYVKNRDGRFVFGNRQLERYTGHPLEGLLGMTDYDFAPKEDADRWRENDLKVLEGQREEFEEIGIDRDGRPYVNLSMKFPLSDESGKPVEVCGISADITERKQAEEALRESEEKYRNLFENMMEQVHFWKLVRDEAGNIKTWRLVDINPAGLKGWGKTRAETIGKTADEIFPDATSHFMTMVTKIFSEDAPYSWESYFPALNQVLQMTSVPLGEFFFTTGVDVTERKLQEEALQNAKEEMEVSAEELRLQNEELIHTQQALQEREEQYRMLFENSLDAIILTDPRDGGKILSANPAACRMLGWTEQELIGKGRETIMDSKDPALSTLLKERERSGSAKAQLTYRRKDGATFPGELSTAFFIGDNGEPRTVAIIRDVTERKKAEEELVKLASFPMFNPNPIVEVDLMGEVHYLNPAAKPLFPDLHEIGCKHPWLADWDSIMQMFHESERGSYSRDIAVGNKSYSQIMYFVPETRCIRIYGEDITERKKAVEELRETKDYLESLIEYANAPIIVWDTSFKITRFNHAFELLAGLRAADVIGRPLDTLFPEDNKETSLDHIRRTLCGERWETVEIPILRADGSIRDVLWNSANIYDPKGTSIIATIAQGQDITKRKQAEDELRKARDVLELRVQERTEELEAANEELRMENEEHQKLEEELRVARDAAEAAVHAKADFMANMSHEIRTPMNAVIGMTSILLEEPLTPEQKDYVETIRTSGNALLVLINDILDFSRLDREKVELEEQFFDLRAVVEESLDQVAPQAAEKGINLGYIMARDVPETIYNDPARLRQVLLNLLNNAAKFTEKGEILLSVGQVPAGVRHEIRFSVQDTGIGIPQDKQEAIFQPFAQVDASLARNHDGVGLGLAISKKLVELMGGKISVKSEPGKGSNFLFTIMAKVIPDEPKKIPTGEQPALKGKRVLIIEESKANRMIFGRLLHEWGVTPLAVASVKDAMESGYLNYGQDYDAAILGANLGQMERTGLAGRMREKNKRLPMILLTPIGMKSTEDFTAVLPLPIKPLQLFNTLINVFAFAPAREAAGVEGQANAGPLRILLAEDNASSQKVTLQMLKKLGYRADLAANGQEAVEAVERQHYDLVLMDVKMPVMNGWDATREIRRLWPANGPKIIALTAYALAGDREKCFAAGMDGYLSKPVALEDLKRVLKEMVTIEAMTT